MSYVCILYIVKVSLNHKYSKTMSFLSSILNNNCKKYRCCSDSSIMNWIIIPSISSAIENPISVVSVKYTKKYCIYFEPHGFMTVIQLYPPLALRSPNKPSSIPVTTKNVSENKMSFLQRYFIFFLPVRIHSKSVNKTPLGIRIIRYQRADFY